MDVVRELLRLAWPAVLAAVLLGLIALLRLVSRNAPRTSRRYRRRVTLLSMLVGLTGGVALTGCETDGGSPDVDAKTVESCYITLDASAEPEAPAGSDDALLCYKDVGVDEVEPDVSEPDAGPAETVMCYADLGPQEPVPEVVPEVVPPDVDDETILCYEPIAPDTTDKG